MLTDGSSPVADAKELIGRGQNRLATELLEPWLEDYPEDAAAWSALGAALFALGEIEEALGASRQVVDLRGTARDWCNHGMLLRKAEHLKEAEEALYRALTIDRNYDKARTELEKVHLARTADEDDGYVES